MDGEKKVWQAYVGAQISAVLALPTGFHLQVQSLNLVIILSKFIRFFIANLNSFLEEILFKRFLIISNPFVSSTMNLRILMQF